MDINVLKELIGKDYCLRQLADHFNCGMTNVRYWLNKHSLKTNHKKGNKKDWYRCQFCGEMSKDKMRQNNRDVSHSICAICHNRRKKNYNRNVRLKAVKYKGSCCKKCGYDKCVAALDFHHLDPNEKDPNWKRIRQHAFEKIKKELDKCDLLCKNCHSELHYGLDKGMENYG